MMWRRQSPNPKGRLAAKDRDKKYEYSNLTRNSEPGKAVTGEYLTSAREDTGKRGGMAVGFRFNAKGGNLFGELTNANRPPREGSGIRYLAIALDGMIMSAPTIQSAITGGSGIIEGHFPKV